MPFAASVVEYFRLQNLERVLVEANPLSEAWLWMPSDIVCKMG